MESLLYLSYIERSKFYNIAQPYIIDKLYRLRVCQVRAFSKSVSKDCFVS